MTVSRCNKPFSKVPKNNPRLLHSKDWTGITQIQITRDILHTKQHGQHRPREFKFKFNSTLYVSAHGVTFMHVLIEELYAPLCITVSYQQHSFYIYVALCTYRSFDAQQQEVYWKCQKAAISTDPRRLFIDLFLINCLDSPMPCYLCLYLIIKFKLYIKLNHIFKSPFIIITFIISNHIFKLYNQFTILA